MPNLQHPEILDNPAYYAAISGNRNLSLGNSAVRYFPAAVSPFVGLREFSDSLFAELAVLLPPGQLAVVVSAEAIVIPPMWKVNHHGIGLQFTGEEARPPVGWNMGSGEARGRAWEFVRLREKDVPQMVELARLTNPGPFGDRTIEFGGFVGVFDGDRLMAMSGHRMHPTPFIEISGVCTHPDYARRGLGSALTFYQVERIREAGETAMLHVWAHNERAIRVYEGLGFVKRRELHFNIIQVAG